MFLASVKETFLKFFVQNWKTKWICSAIIALILGVLYLKFKPVFFIGDYLLKIVLGIAITLFVLIANSRIELGNRISLFLGSISFEIYLVHGFAFGLMGRLREWKYSSFFIICSIIVTIIYALVIHFVAEKILGLLKRWKVSPHP